MKSLRDSLINTSTSKFLVSIASNPNPSCLNWRYALCARGLYLLTMPKAVPTLYNHSERLSTSRILSIGTTPSGRRNVTSRSTSLLVPQAHAPPPMEYYPMDLDDDLNNAGFEHDPEQPTALNPGDVENDEESQPVESGVNGIKVKPPKAKRYANSVRRYICSNIAAILTIFHQDAPLQTWLGYRDEYLDECMALEGQGRWAKSCAGCQKPFPQFRCKDCTHGALWCKECLLLTHHQNPLHSIEVRYFYSLANHTLLIWGRLRCGIRCSSKRRPFVIRGSAFNWATRPEFTAQRRTEDIRTLW